jgi:hypothetical protein
MSDASDQVSKTLEAMRAEREQTGSRLVTGAEILYGKVKRFLKRNGDVDLLALDGEELLEELEVAYFSSGGRDVPAELREAIQQKIAARLTAAIAPRQKDPGGAPPKFNWNLVIREVMRKVSIDGVPAPGAQRAELQSHIMDFCHKIWGDNAPAENTVRAKLADWLPACM